MTAPRSDAPRRLRGLNAADAAQVAMFAALIAALGVVGSIPMPVGVPITLQTLGVMLAGALLGARRGALAVIVLLVLAAAGLPVLAGGRGGLGVFAGPTVGYLIGFVVGAFVIGLIVDRFRRIPNVAQMFLICVVGGIVTIYLVGIPVQAMVLATPLKETITGSMIVFLPGDLLKAALASVVAVGVFRAYPPASPVTRREARLTARAANQ